MSQKEKLVAKLLSGTSDANFPFNGLCQYLKSLEFEERIEGSHHIYTKEGVEEILNLQPNKKDKAKAKAYHVKQVRAIILKYRLIDQDENEI